MWLAIADVNADHQLDLLVANVCADADCKGLIGVLFGNGDGTFRKALTYDSGGYFANFVAVADVIGDQNKAPPGRPSSAGHARNSMKIVVLCLGLTVAAVGAVGLTAQERPNLSGAWGSVDPQQHIRELTIKHDGSTLAVEGQPDVISVTYTIGGSESKMNLPNGKHVLAKAAWAGNTLVLTIHDPETKQDIRRQTWAIDRDEQLVIVTEFVGSAATTRDGKPQAPVKEVFKRR